MSLIPSFFLSSVVAICYKNQKNDIIPTATGFLIGISLGMNIEKDEECTTFLISNRHVFNNNQEVAYIRFNSAKGESPAEIPLHLYKSGKEIWRTSPDPDIDIAVIPINLNVLDQVGLQSSFFYDRLHIADRQKAQDEGITEGNPIFTLGFPMGLIGKMRDYVIVRHGIIARISDWYSNQEKSFLIDCTVFPGNSGGPVINAPELVAINKTKGINKAYLLGVVSSYIPYEDIAVSPQTGRPRVSFIENSGLANVVPIDYALDIAKKLTEEYEQKEKKTEK